MTNGIGDLAWENLERIEENDRELDVLAARVVEIELAEHELRLAIRRVDRVLKQFGTAARVREQMSIIIKDLGRPLIETAS